MILTVENLFGARDTIEGKTVRVTRKGLFVDNILWHQPGEEIQILDITEEK